MKKMLTVALMMLLMMSINAFASETRVMTMGHNNTILLDDANIWEFPSRINDYPNLAVGEFSIYDGDNGFGNFGIHWKFGDDNNWVLGTYVSTYAPWVPQRIFTGGYPYDYRLIPFDNNFSAWDNRGINLFFGYKMDAMNFGIGLATYGSAFKTDNTNDEREESFAYYDLSLGMTEESNQLDVTMNIGIGTFTDKDANGDTEYESDGFLDFGLNGRIFFQTFDKVTLVPHFEFGYCNRGIKHAEYTDYTFSQTGIDLDLGCGLNFTPATNVLAVLDFGFALDVISEEEDFGGTSKTEKAEANVYLPYINIGMDADVFKWMDIRFGATHSNKGYGYAETIEPSDEEKNGKGYAENATYLGFGFHWGRLHVDTYTDPGMFLKGFNFLSGANNDMNFQISATYEMM